MMKLILIFLMLSIPASYVYAEADISIPEPSAIMNKLPGTIILANISGPTEDRATDNINSILQNQPRAMELPTPEVQSPTPQKNPEPVPSAPKSANQYLPNWDPLLNWSFTPGIGVRVVSLEITRKSDKYTGTLTNDGSFTDPIYLSFDIETPGFLLSNNVGISVRSHSQTFSVSNQKVPSSTTQSGTDYANLGTSARGYYSYFGPTIFYRILERDGDIRYGAGYGKWKAWFEGNIILAPNGAATPNMPKTRINGAIDGSTGPILFFQIRAKKYIFEVAISRVSFSNSEYDTTLDELGMSLGYTVSY